MIGAVLTEEMYHIMKNNVPFNGKSYTKKLSMLPDYMRKYENEEDYNEQIPVKTVPKIGRNDLCLCGSGKKYKKCCGK